MVTNTIIHSNLAIPPGEYLEEVIRELGMTKDELARRMGRPAAKLSHIFKGEKAITPETALQLETVVGVPAHIWIGLEAEYRLTLARQEEESRRDRLKEETGLVKRFCYGQLVKLGAAAKRVDPVDQVLEMQRYFGVTSLKQVLELRRYSAAFRRGGLVDVEHPQEAIASWLRLGELAAQRIQCEPFSKARLQAALQDVRGLTLLPPEGFVPQLSETLANAGVALVLCPHLTGTKAHGATFWLKPDKAVLMATIRGRWADIFWFSLCHEIGHILLHSRQDVILEDGYASMEVQTREREADEFASDHLISPDMYKSFVRRGVFYPANIEAFAEQVGVHPGVVVGRLQHDKLLKPQWRNDLRTRYVWANEEHARVN